MDVSSKRKRDEEMGGEQDSKELPSKLLKESTSHELRTPNREEILTASTPKETESKPLIELNTPNGRVSRLLNDSQTPNSRGSKQLKESKTPNGIGPLTESLTPNVRGIKLLRPSLTPAGKGSKLLKESKTPNGIGGKQAKTPRGVNLSKFKTPKSAKRKEKVRMWCCDCATVAGSGCALHSRLDAETARQRAAAALRLALDNYRRLDALVLQSAPRLRCTVSRGLGGLEIERHGQDVNEHAGNGDRVEEEGEEVMEIELASNRLHDRERQALCAYLEGLALDPYMEHLSASSAGCEAIATKCAKLPDRPEGIALKPGAILLLGTCDRSMEQVLCQRGGGGSGCENDSDSDDDRNSSWLGEAPPALRVYYEEAVMPHQGRGAKVLGYIQLNKNLSSFLESARPRDACDSVDVSHGRQVVISNVSFI